jgi:hypothetical protein
MLMVGRLGVSWCNAIGLIQAMEELLDQGLVIPAKAGIQQVLSQKTWVPACAGMTGKALRYIN